MLFFAAILLSQSGRAPESQALQGADIVLQQLHKVTTAKGAASISDTGEEIRAYAARSERLSPDEAARGWLKLLTDVRAPWDSGSHSDGPKSADVVAVLPPPSAWPRIASLVSRKPVAKRSYRDQVLVLLFDELTGKGGSERSDIAALFAKSDSNEYGPNSLQSAVQLNVMLATNSGDRKWLADAAVKYYKVTGEGPGDLRGTDFVTIVGVQRARSLFKALLLANKLKTSASYSSNGPETTDLLVKLTIELLPKLKAAPWGLAARLRSAGLYPLLAKRWPNASGDPSNSFGGDERSMAKVAYGVKLELAGKHDLALAQTNDWDWPKADRSSMFWIQELLDTAESKQAFVALETKIAEKHPERVPWESFETMANEIGRLSEFETVAEAALKTGHLDPSAVKSLEKLHLQKLLETDQVDEAVAILRKRATSPADPQDSDAGAYQASLHLAVLGLLTGHSEWTDEGLADAERIDSQHSSGEGVHYMGRDQSLEELLVTLGRAPEAEQYLERQLTSPSDPGYGGEASREPLLAELAELYYRSNRPADVLALFQRAPGWGASDLSELYFPVNPRYGARNGTSLGFYAAWALANTDKRTDALRVLEPTLYFNQAFDPGYALLLDLEGVDAIPLLDKLFQRDRFEPRPLIWKAEALRRVGRLSEAEVVARNAISLDPSDGQSPAGDRLRAYAVLADIRSAQGAAEEAGQLKNAVEAIRMAEHADDYIQAGLIKRGTEAYQAALAKFDDAYCIQSRLAVQLASEGHNEEAAEHFRRAYELMPSSFGRVESHCFGCEGAFSSPQAQRIAIDTLGKIEKKTPNNPRVHYLLGYLFEEELRSKEAVAEYKRATELDPDYLNAWKKLASSGPVADHATVAAAQLAITRLDPNGFHSDNVATSSLNPIEVWNAVHKSLSSSYVMPSNLMKLTPGPKGPASSPREEVGWARVSTNDYDLNHPWRIPNTPSFRVSQLSVIREIADLLSNDERSQRMLGSG